MNDFDSPLFKTSLVAAAAGVPIGTLRAYFSRGHWRLIGKKAEGEGLPNLFGLRDAMTFAVAARLIDAAGLHPKDAFEIAVGHFAYTGTHDRAPSELFDIHERGETLLIYYPDMGKTRLVAADDVRGMADLLGVNQNAAEAAVVLVLNPLYQRVCAALG